MCSPHKSLQPNPHGASRAADVVFIVLFFVFSIILFGFHTHAQKKNEKTKKGAMVNGGKIFKTKTKQIGKAKTNEKVFHSLPFALFE